MKTEAGTMQGTRRAGSSRARPDPVVQVGQYLASGQNHERCVRRVVEEAGVCDEGEAESVLVRGYARAVVLLRRSQQRGCTGPMGVAQAIRSGVDQELWAHGKSSSSA